MRPDDIAATLRRAIRERILSPGQALNQDELAGRFGVSRIPLREALRTLVGEGLIHMEPGLGAVVTELSADEVNELYSLRLQLEPPLSPFIVDHVRPHDIGRLGELVEKMQDIAPDQSEEWSSLSYGFHRHLYELSDRRHTVRLVVQVLNLVEPYARLHAHLLGSRDRIQAQHAALVEVLRVHDAEQVRTLVSESITFSRSELVRSMAEQSPPVDPLREWRGQSSFP